MRFAFDLDLPDERRDGLDGIRHGEKAHQRQARVRQPRVNPLADGPDVGFPGQRGEGLDRIVGDDIVELSHQPLIRPENHCADHTRSGGPFRFTLGATGSLSRKHAPSPSSTVR
jgi:hypothetical protein